MYAKEYTFRAWDRLKNVMYDWKECQTFYLEVLFSRSRFVVMEGVGYRDKRAKRIFEYDVIQDKNGRIGMVFYLEGEFVIKWKIKGKGIRHGESELLDRETAQKMMVIGNRFTKIER